MEGFSTASQAALCTTISHRAIACAAEVDEASSQWNQSDPALPQLLNLSNRLRELNAGADGLANSLNRGAAISVDLQQKLTQTTGNCARAIAAIEKEFRASSSRDAGSITLNPLALSEYERWATLLSHTFEVLTEMIQT
jgi:hypothetical protein